MGIFELPNFKSFDLCYPKKTWIPYKSVLPSSLAERPDFLFLGTPASASRRCVQLHASWQGKQDVFRIVPSQSQCV